MGDDNKKFNDPTGRAVCAFENHDHALSARADLVGVNFTPEQITVLNSKADAREIDASAKWFADTDEDIKRYKHEIEIGNTVLSVPIADDATLQRVRHIFDANGGRMMTYFGDWVTTTEDLSGD